MTDNSIISKIFDVYLDNEFEGINPVIGDDCKEVYDNLEKFEQQHHFSNSDIVYLDTEIISELTYASKLKGFEDGFKLAVRLLLENTL